MATVTIYTRESCEFCTKAKETLTNQGISYQEKTLGVDFKTEDIRRDFPYQKTYPIIVDEAGRLVGGYTELLHELSAGNTLGKVQLNG